MKKKNIAFILFFALTNFIYGQNNCLSFDGSNDYVDVPSSAAMTLTSSLTMEVWVKQVSSSGFQIVLNKEGEYEIAIQNGVFLFAIGNDWVFKNTGFSIPNNTWTHLAVTYDGSNYFAYANGSEVYTEASTGIIMDIVPGQDDFWIGWRQALLNDHFFGFIDEVRIWNIALTSNQLSTLYNGEFSDPSTPSSCLVANYQFNESTGNSLSDATGNGNTGTLINMGNDDWVTSDIGISSISAPTCASLPVELLEFKANLTQEKILLNWTTASELNNLGFEIQKSINGNDWDIIDFVEGQGTSNELFYYSFEDVNPYSEINYYRLKQIDFDGKFEYSKVITITNNKEREIEIYPNPTKGRFEVEGVESAGIRMMDNFGRTIKELTLKNQTIDISEFPSGIYILSINTGEEFIIKRIIKE